MVTLRPPCTFSASLANADRRLSSSWIAGSVVTNAVVIRQIIGKLREAGLVETTTGSCGGTVLARAAAEITLADAYAALDEGSLFGLHANEPNRALPCGPKHPVDPDRRVWRSGCDGTQSARQNDRSQMWLSELIS